MKRIDAPGATPDFRFTEGNPGTGTPATDIAADWLNSVQEEICSVIEAAGIALNGAAVNQLLLAIRIMQYPIGSIYITARTDLTAFQLLGFGTWVQIGAGQTLVARDASQIEFATVGQTGGSKTHALTTAQNASHSHQIGSRDAGGADATGTGPNQELVADFGYSGVGAGPAATTSSSGNGAPHNNLQPYYVVGAFWRRTA